MPIFKNIAISDVEQLPISIDVIFDTAARLLQKTTLSRF
jgi:hypothetical protein